MLDKKGEVEKANSVEIEFIDLSNRSVVVSAELGSSLMTSATSALVEGIDGDCGGASACGTCRVEIDPRLLNVVEGPGSIEMDLLESLAAEDDGVRLGCQILVTAAFEGKTFKVAT